MQKKTVRFRDNCILNFTYAPDEYDRCQIDSLVYRKSYQRVSHAEWILVMEEINYFKLNEMIVHKSSVHNTYLHVIPNT